MGKGAADPPPAPDPRATIAAQGASNADTARLTARLNRVNQVGPSGSITYSEGAPSMDRATWENNEVARARAAFQPGTAQPGTPMFTPGGENASAGMDMGGGAQPGVFDEEAFRRTLEGRMMPTTPGQDVWTATTTLSPEEKRIYDLTTQGRTTYGETANNILNSVKDSLSTPVSTDWEGERARALAAQRTRLDPVYLQQEEALRQRLRNSGLSEGSEGWNREFRNFNQGRNDALVAADLRAGDLVGQGIAQTTALRAMPLNEASALLTGSMVNVPSLMNTPSANVAPTDVIGATNGAYANNMAAWNASNNSNNAAMGGLFGLAGTLGGAALGSPWLGGMLGGLAGRAR